jgi:hypothetical protein
LFSLPRSLTLALWTGLSSNQVFAGVLAVEHSQDGEQRGLARARRTHDRDEIAFGDLEADLAENPSLAALVGIGLLDAV